MRRSATLALRAVVAGGILAAAVEGAVAARAKETKGRGEAAWTHPAFADHGVRRIAMLPVATYDANLSAEKQVERVVGAALVGAGYRWISATTTRDLLRAAGGDSLLRTLRDGVLEQGRADSLAAPGTCAMLRCDALLTVRVDQWEQREVEWNQSGKPTTTVRLRAALVDSTGALLWRASGSETGEGPYHNPETAPLGVSESGLERKPITGQGGAPSHLEVMAPILERWTKAFPTGPATPATPGAAAGGGDSPPDAPGR